MCIKADLCILSLLAKLPAKMYHMLQGGLGDAAATLTNLLKDFKGLEACRSFYRALLKLAAPGGSFFHGILEIELNEQASRLPDSKIKAIFEVRALFHAHNISST